jgi:hypothetical protein
MPPGHTGDLGRTRYFFLWTVEQMTAAAAKQTLTHRAREMLSAEGTYCASLSLSFFHINL